MNTLDKQIKVPNPETLAHVQKIGDLTAPFHFDSEYENTFVKAMLESVAWHAKGSDFYRKLLEQNNFDPSQVKTLEDCFKIPFIPANTFKTHEILSRVKDDSLMHFTSSGTSGQKSQMFFDDWSFRSGQRMVDSVFRHFDFIRPEEKTNYLLYSYETDASSKLGTAYTDHYLCKYAPAVKVTSGLRRTGQGGHEFDVFGCMDRLTEYAEAGLPVRIFGFPAFLYFTLKRMKDLKRPNLKLSENSLIFLGGGWKGHANQEVSKSELRSLVEECLGIPPHRVRDSFGAVEHAIPYSECEYHHFHVPVWSRVIIRDVKTLKPCPMGEAGFLQFVTPFITSVPAHSILMGDLATLFPAGDCKCGIQSPFFEVHGRAGTSKNKSCAVAASEMLRRK